ncbi:MAG: taurine dioxygenase [Gammaproteobacteria bacterium]|jgi:taurine dioxygenase
MSIELNPLSDAIGVEIHGADLSRPLSDEDFADIEAAWNAHALLLFRGQTLTPQQHIAFSARFGELAIHVLDQWRLQDHPEIIIVSNVRKDDKPIGIYNAGRYWHTDLSYMQAPSRGSLLYAIEVPRDGDRVLGDTTFANTTAAFAGLDEATKTKIADLTATFSLSHQRAKLLKDGDTGASLTPEQLAKTPVCVHHIVQEHPVTGRKLLFINEGHTIEIQGLAEDEQRALREQLCAHCTKPEFTYRHNWREGDLLMWDNVQTQHLAHFDYEQSQPRYMLRTTLRGAEMH